MDKNFWSGKTVLITGHTGFKGTWLFTLLNSVGSQLYGLSDKVLPSPNIYEATNSNGKYVKEYFVDIRNREQLHEAIDDCKPEIIFHLAAQPIVIDALKEPIETFETNVLGTANLLDACRKTNSVKTIVNITTDKVYKNAEWYWPYRENEQLGGKDPYSASKSCADICASSFYHAYLQDKSVGLSNVRAGNVIGGGDWANSRLIPDFFRAQNSGNVLSIRNPKSIRPWQHVIEPIVGYITLAEKMYSDPDRFSGDWNFGPKESDCQSVDWIISYLNKISEKKVVVNYDSVEGDKESKLLKLDSSKASYDLDWTGKLTIENALHYCVEWQEEFNKGGNIAEITLKQIEEYLAK